MIIRAFKIAALLAAFFIIAGISAFFTLTLFIKSEDSVIIPELAGKDLVYTLEILSDLGLNIKVKGSEYSKEIPKNHIIFQDPEPGAEIKKGRDVKIIISKGAKTVLMPKLEGLLRQQARIIVEENDLHMEAQSSSYSSIIKKDEIISQSPSPGVMVKRGETVSFLVSLGNRPRAYMMPDLTGIILDDALFVIENYNLLLGEIKSIIQKNKPQNVIVKQAPESGHRVVEGSVVNLVINRQSDLRKGSQMQGSFGIKLFRYRLEYGFLRKRIRVRVNCFGISNEFFNEFIKPGMEIWTLIPRDRDATVFLYKDNDLIQTKVFDAW